MDNIRAFMSDAITFSKTALNFTTFSITTLSILHLIETLSKNDSKHKRQVLSLSVVRLNAIMLSAIRLNATKLSVEASH